MDYWKIMVGAIALMWGTRTECEGYQARVNGEGGNAHVERCTKADIEAICNRMWL